MGIKTKLTLAVGFVGAIAIAATAFGQAGSEGPAPTTSTAPRAPRRAAANQGRQRQQRCAPVRPRATRRIVHGEMKVATRAGAFANVTVDTGEITAVDNAANTITVKRADGQTVTATATDRTKVCLDGQPSTFGALKTGDRARLMQVRSDRFTGLRRIVAVSPQEASGAGSASATDFGGDDLSSLLDEAA